MCALTKKSFSALLIVLTAIFSAVFFCPGVSAIGKLPSTDGADTVYLWNAEYNKVIFSKSTEKTIYPASTTKIMTGLVAIDLVGSRLDEKIILTDEMLSDKKGTSLQLKVGEVLTFRDLLYGSVCGGFNDATNALAVASAGSITEFVARMNEKAKELGALNTFYTNPTGWHDDAMVTTLYDTAIIAKAAMKNELYVTVSSASSYTVNEESRSYTVHNRNALISSHYAYGYYNRRAKGLIAGMTDEGGYCVATFAEYDGLSYLCIVMGAGKKDENIMSYTIANALISCAISYYGELEVIGAGETVTTIPLKYAPVRGDNNEYMLKCTVSEDVVLFTPYDNASLDTIELKPYFFSDTLSAPVTKGQTVGGVDIFIDGIYRGHAPLCASETVAANGLLLGIHRAKDFLMGRFFITFIIIFAVIFGVYFYNTEMKQLRKKHKNIKFDKLY